MTTASKPPWIATTADGTPREHLEPARYSRLTCPHGLWWHLSCKECDANRERVAAQLNCPVFYCKDRNHTHLSLKSAVLCNEQIDRAASLGDTFACQRRYAETEAIDKPRVTITESGPIPVPSLRDRIGNYLCARPTLCMVIAYIAVVCALLFFAYTLGWAALVTGAVRK